MEVLLLLLTFPQVLLLTFTFLLTECLDGFRGEDVVVHTNITSPQVLAQHYVLTDGACQLFFLFSPGFLVVHELSRPKRKGAKRAEVLLIPSGRLPQT